MFLTSAGFENKKVGRKALEATGKRPEELKALFVPTAAVTPRQQAILPLCLGEIRELGLKPENILEVEVADIAKLGDIKAYDLMYVAGGDTEHLTKEMRTHGFKERIDRFLENGVYVGVSAGSIALSGESADCLGYLPCGLRVHEEVGDAPGDVAIVPGGTVRLTDNQVLILENGRVLVFE
ncbi:MAG: Type 1 glutamine amidotransferase-like domain-containing protein [Spirochaetaceae bacterium]|nr:Type 1 glutamine amidotransferase-like domain-containing protein [Spirochaetaceae bacterium]